MYFPQVSQETTNIVGNTRAEKAFFDFTFFNMNAINKSMNA